MAIEERSPAEKWYDCYYVPPPPVPVAVPVMSHMLYGSGAHPPPMMAFKSSSPSSPRSKSSSTNANIYPIPAGAPPGMMFGGSGGGGRGGYGGDMKDKERKKRSDNSMQPQFQAQQQQRADEGYGGGAQFDMFFSAPASASASNSAPYSVDLLTPTSSLAFAPPPAPARASSPPAPLSSGSSDPYTKMGNLLALQSTQGFFAFSPQLAGAVGTAFPSLQGVVSSLPALLQVADSGVRERVWATVVALVFLKKRLADLADEWELVDKKARKWLATLNLQQLDSVFTAAEGLI